MEPLPKSGAARIGSEQVSAAALLIAACLLWACSTGSSSTKLETPARSAVEFEWRLPLGFPRPPVPTDNPMSAVKVELGRRLFYDKRLSGNGVFACASCHRQELAFSDGLPRAVGATGETHPRSSMSLANVAYNASFAWADPRLRSLEAQAHVPMFNRHPVELGVEGTGAAMIERLARDRQVEALFAQAFPDEALALSVTNITKALAAFERTLISGNSAYDARVFLDNRSAMSEQALAGMRLFFSERLGCFECHSGFNFSGPVIAAGQPRRELVFHNTGLYNLGPKGLYPGDNPGLAEHTGKKRDNGRFRAPTLRNIALTAPYMHDGSVATLPEVIDHYAAGGRTLSRGPHAGIGRDNPRRSPLVKGFSLTEGDKAALVAFLNSLTDETFVTDPRFADPFVPVKTFPRAR